MANNNKNEAIGESINATTYQLSEGGDPFPFENVSIYGGRHTIAKAKLVALARSEHVYETADFKAMTTEDHWAAATRGVWCTRETVPQSITDAQNALDLTYGLQLPQGSFLAFHCTWANIADTVFASNYAHQPAGMQKSLAKNLPVEFCATAFSSAGQWEFAHYNAGWLQNNQAEVRRQASKQAKLTKEQIAALKWTPGKRATLQTLKGFGLTMGSRSAPALMREIVPSASPIVQPLSGAGIKKDKRVVEKKKAAKPKKIVLESDLESDSESEEAAPEEAKAAPEEEEEEEEEEQEWGPYFRVSKEPLGIRRAALSAVVKIAESALTKLNRKRDKSSVQKEADSQNTATTTPPAKRRTNDYMSAYLRMGEEEEEEEEKKAAEAEAARRAAASVLMFVEEKKVEVPSPDELAAAKADKVLGFIQAAEMAQYEFGKQPPPMMAKLDQIVALMPPNANLVLPQQQPYCAELPAAIANEQHLSINVEPLSECVRDTIDGKSLEQRYEHMLQQQPDLLGVPMARLSIDSDDVIDQVYQRLLDEPGTRERFGQAAMGVLGQLALTNCNPNAINVDYTWDNVESEAWQFAVAQTGFTRQETQGALNNRGGDFGYFPDIQDAPLFSDLYFTNEF